MPTDFRRVNLIRREELLLADGPGVSDAGRLIFLSSEGGKDRLHRMDLARLRRFSIDRESRAPHLTLLGSLGGLLLLMLAASLTTRTGGTIAAACLVGGLTVVVATLAVALTRVRVRLSFEDASRTRTFVAWATAKKLARFETRLAEAVEDAQATR